MQEITIYFIKLILYGLPIPDVEYKINNPDSEGNGEIIVKNENGVFEILVHDSENDKTYRIDAGTGNPNNAARNIFSTRVTVNGTEYDLVCLVRQYIYNAIFRNKISVPKSLDKIVGDVYKKITQATTKDKIPTIDEADI